MSLELYEPPEMWVLALEGNGIISTSGDRQDYGEPIDREY